MPTPLSTFRAAAINVFKSVSLQIHSLRSDWDFAQGQDIINGLIKFLRESATALGRHRYAFELTQADENGGVELTSSRVVAEGQQGPAIIRLGKALRIIDSRPLVVAGSEPEEGDFSLAAKDTVIAMFEGDASVVFFANTATVRVVNLKMPDRTPPRRGGRWYSPDDYESAILEHYRSKVKYNWQETDHWEDRNRRVLRTKLGNRKTTESIFHCSLFGYLTDVIPEASVRSTPRDTASDEPDLVISALGCGPFLAEIKWLGTNGSTTYGIARLKDGVKQLGDYLDKEAKFCKGTLVVYDARDRNHFDGLEYIDLPDIGCRCIEKCEDIATHARGYCMVLFLESTTASQQ